MEEDIKILEQFLYGNKLTCENCEEKCNECYIEYEEVQAVARLIKGYRELEEREIWSTATINGLKRDFIPKSKIKEKIEELDKQRIKMEQDDVGVGFTLGNECSDLKAKIQILQELLGDE